jgi:hypothetical protein
LIALGGCRSFVACSITKPIPIRSRSWYGPALTDTLSVRRWVAL